MGVFDSFILSLSSKKFQVNVIRLMHALPLFIEFFNIPNNVFIWVGGGGTEMTMCSSFSYTNPTRI